MVKFKLLTKFNAKCYTKCFKNGGGQEGVQPLIRFLKPPTPVNQYLVKQTDTKLNGTFVKISVKSKSKFSGFLKISGQTLSPHNWRHYVVTMTILIFCPQINKLHTRLQGISHLTDTNTNLGRCKSQICQKLDLIDLAH